jgi:hypothetical protein
MAITKHSRRQGAPQAQEVSLTSCSVAGSAADGTQKRKTTATNNNINNTQEAKIPVCQPASSKLPALGKRHPRLEHVCFF